VNNVPSFFSGISIWSLILLIAGIGFLAAEIFHPGFGVPGVLGILALVFDILISARTFAQGLLMTAIAAVIVLVVFIIGTTLIDRGKLPKIIVLEDENSSGAGFVSSDAEVEKGQTGKAVTVLRPAGIAEIGGRRADVVTRGEYLPAGAQLQVESVEGGKIIVRLCEEQTEE